MAPPESIQLDIKLPLVLLLTSKVVAQRTKMRHRVIRLAIEAFSTSLIHGMLEKGMLWVSVLLSTSKKSLSAACKEDKNNTFVAISIINGHKLR